jgi:sigma-B regulation protein RsbU (phosphoserine phosphatase)
VFYSDGITEAVNCEQEEYGQLRLQNHVLENEASPESIVEHVRSFAEGEALPDDASVIVVRA